MKKIIILTLPLENNYGGLMQAYALQRVISEMGFDVVTDKNACKRHSWKYKVYSIISPLVDVFLFLLRRKILTRRQKTIRDQNLIRFINENIKTTNFFRGKLTPTRRQIDKYDTFIVGSDQVWRKEYVWVRSYMLEFLKEREDKRRIAYSGSFGQDTLEEWSKEDKCIGKDLFPRFYAVSVREESGKNILESEFGVKSSLVLDPTMLLTKSDYLKLNGIEKIPTKEKLLYCYFLDLNDDKKKLIEYVRKEKGIDNVFYVLPKQKVNPTDKTNFVLPSIGKWLSGFRDAEFVVTDSFHGTVFSILFNKQFICYANKSRGVSRMDTLLSEFKLKDRMIFSSREYSGLQKIDYTDVNIILENRRKESIDFLMNSLS